LHSTPFKRNNDQLEYHGVFIFEYSSRLRGISTSWSLSPLQIYDHKESTRVRIGEQHTQDSNPQHNHAHKSRLELKTQHREYATQTELKSLTQRIKCVETESRSLRMFLAGLVFSSMRLGVPFIALRQLGAVGDQLGRHFLPSIEWCTPHTPCTGQSGAPPDSPVHHRTATVHVRCVISFYIGRSRPLLLGASWRTGHCPVHTGQSGAHRTVRCTQPIVGASHVSRADRADDRWPLAPLAHRIVR
jgi:hypothetical protein